MLAKFVSLEGALLTKEWWRSTVMNHGEMCVNSLLDHMKQIPYADSLVTRVQLIITPQKECKYSMQFVITTIITSSNNFWAGINSYQVIFRSCELASLSLSQLLVVCQHWDQTHYCRCPQWQWRRNCSKRDTWVHGATWLHWLLLLLACIRVDACSMVIHPAVHVHETWDPCLHQGISSLVLWLELVHYHH